MVRRRQQKHQAVRRAQHAAKAHLDADHGAYTAPPRDQCTAKQWDMIEDDANTTRAQLRIWRNRGALVDFVVTIQVLTSDGWVDVERFDCCHGHCHRHREGGESIQNLVRLDRVDDVQRAFEQVGPLISQRLRMLRGEEGTDDG